MEKIRPQGDFAAKGADRFELRLARGEYESLQVLVMPTHGDLESVQVEVSDLVRARQGSLDWFSAADTLPAAASMALSKGGLISLRVKFLKGKREIASDQIDLNPKAAREALADLRVARIAAPQLTEDEKTRTFTMPGGAISFCKRS